VDARIDTVEPSLTAVVVVEPMDLSRLMDCYDRVYAFLRGGTEVMQTGQNIALYEHGERMEVGVEVDRIFDPAGPVVSSRLPGGRIAHATHTTGYEDLHRTYDAISEWCEANGQRTTGIQWEVYADPDESRHVNVEICYLCGDRREL
jgi:effector-binding domain-containing protein